MSPAEIAAEGSNPDRLLMGTHLYKRKRLDIAYAPFDHVNTGADIVIVGITPGKQQMREAIEEARRAMKLGLSDAEVLARAKVHASFAGSMRKNLVRLLDAVGLNRLLESRQPRAFGERIATALTSPLRLGIRRLSMGKTIADRLI